LRVRVSVDLQKCEAHGDCVLVAPTVFELDDSGSVVVVLQEEPAEELRSQVEAAARLCPVAAITVED
jgi:ferredoxin